MEQIFKDLLEAGTAVISDVFDTMEFIPPVLDNGLFQVTGPGTHLIGPAYTIEGESHRWSGRSDRAKLEAIDGISSGAVALWAGNDIRGVCCFGDLLAEAMKARGAAGVVVDGGIRDIAYIRKMGLPMYVRYKTSAQAITRWRVTNHQVPVRVRGAVEDWITVHPGDIVVADDDGAIIVPKSLLEKVAAKVMEWATKDSRARDDIRQGTLLLDALEKYGHL